MSQFKEDEHIEAVFNEIGFGSKVLCDIGARYEGSNSENLIRRHGFTAVLVDASRHSCDELERMLPSAKVICETLKPEEVNNVVPNNCWFLSIDIDSTDWWMWANLRYRPALVVIETNPRQGVFVARMDCGRKNLLGYGCSVEAAKLLGDLKGYDYIGRTEANCFFVRKDLKCQYRLPEMREHKGVPCEGENNIFA